MRKSIKILVCVLITVIICLLNKPVYAKELRDYDVLEIINYCAEREKQVYPMELTPTILNTWRTQIDNYDKKHLIKNYDEIASKARKIMNKWLESMESWTIYKILTYFNDHNIGSSIEPDVKLSDINKNTLKAWLETVEPKKELGYSLGGSINIANIYELISDEIKVKEKQEAEELRKQQQQEALSKQKAEELKREKLAGHNPESPMKEWVPYTIEKYFIDNNICGKNDHVLVPLSNIDTGILVTWYKTMKRGLGKSLYVVNGIGQGKVLGLLQNELVNRGINYKDIDVDFNYIEIEKDLEYWKPNSTGENKKLEEITEKILGVIQVFGSIVSVLALVIIGIKYMIGSVSEKAKYKEVMIPYVIGCVMLFAITNIVGVIYKFAINL